MVTIIKYQVRTSGAQPKSDGCPSGVPHTFILQTFGAFKTLVDVKDATTTLLRSADMQGLKAGDVEDPAYRASTYTQASYSGRALRTTDGTPVYTANESHVAEWVDEDEVPNWTS